MRVVPALVPELDYLLVIGGFCLANLSIRSPSDFVAEFSRETLTFASEFRDRNSP